MPLKDLLKKKDKSSEPGDEQKSNAAPAPEFTFMRTTTTTQEFITPPAYPGDDSPDKSRQAQQSNRLSFRRRSQDVPRSNDTSEKSSNLPATTKQERRLSDRLHLRSRSRGSSTSSVNLPTDLPDVGDRVAKSEDDQAEWEKRATLLAQGNPIARPGSAHSNKSTGEPGRPTSQRKRSTSVSNPKGDENIQEAIRLHEAGDLENSTALFGKLADPEGENNALSQVLYGLALRHGWGCKPNTELAVQYLSYAASNSADIETLALQAGMKKGGSAKGELVLAIFELANCFRNGWGVARDPVAARTYYETAANLGDTDAMNEAAWCYLEGFGCKKDKFKAAQYLRLAEEKGSKILGNSWLASVLPSSICLSSPVITKIRHSTAESEGGEA